jgi:hypothetical protein
MSYHADLPSCAMRVCVSIKPIRLLQICMFEEPISTSKVHTKECPILYRAIACSNRLDTSYRPNDFGRDARAWNDRHAIFQCLIRIHHSIPTANLRLIASAGYITISLTFRSFACNIITAPTLIPFLQARKTVGSAITAIFALWHTQRCVSIRAHVLFKNRSVGILSITT